MSTNLIHIVVFVLLLSLTAHEVHASISHDVDNCDVCIHIQFNDKLQDKESYSFLLLDLAFHIKVKAATDLFEQSTINSTDHIRGPPLIS